MKNTLFLLLLFFTITASIAQQKQATTKDGEMVTLFSDGTWKYITKNYKSLRFLGYEEGDTPHLLFKDIKTGKEYDLNNLSKNNYRNIKLLIEKNSNAFGVSGNPKYVNKLFKVKLKKVLVKKYNPEPPNNVITVEDWVIEDIILYK